MLLKCLKVVVVVLFKLFVCQGYDKHKDRKEIKK